VAWINREREFEIRSILEEFEIRYTKKRALIYDLLSQSERPLDARTLLVMMEARFGADGSRSEGARVWLSTVYRTLDLFTEKGLTEKLILSSDDQALYVLAPTHHEHYAICTRCQRIFDIQTCPEDVWEEELAAQGFVMTGHRVEVLGICLDCYKKEHPDNDLSSERSL